MLEGSNVTLFCNASVIPEPLVSWVNVRNDQRTPGKNLAFENITRYQAGEYRCEATNSCGNDTESVTIDVQCKPFFSFCVVLTYFLAHCKLMNDLIWYFERFLVCFVIL